MKINFAHLCDYALISRDGKLSVMGLFDNINVAQLPAAHPTAFLAFEIGLHTAELGRPFALRIDCVDQDGRLLFQASANLHLAAREGFTPTIGDKPRVPQVIGIANLLLQRDGPHQINIWLAERLEHTLEFRVALVHPTQSGGPPSA